MASFTTEQYLPVTFKIVDGRGRPAPVEGTPVVASSDETVATCSEVTDAGDGSWDFSLNSVAEGTARIAVTADADLGAGISEIIGTLDVEVTTDPRTAERTIELTAGTPSDEPLA